MYQQKSNLQEIYEWLSIAKTLPTEPQMPSVEQQSLVLKLMLEELTEMAESGGIEVLKEWEKHLNTYGFEVTLKKHNVINGVETLNEGLHHFIDSIVDGVFILHNNTCFAGLTKEYPEHFEKVINSNWTKFDVNAKDAFITKQSYLDKGIDTHFEEKVLNDTTYYVTYRNDKKIMKSYRFKEPQLTLFN
jgi:hypothetical protein